MAVLAAAASEADSAVDVVASPAATALRSVAGAVLATASATRAAEDASAEAERVVTAAHLPTRLRVPVADVAAGSIVVATVEGMEGTVGMIGVVGMVIVGEGMVVIVEVIDTIVVGMTVVEVGMIGMGPATDTLTEVEEMVVGMTTGRDTVVGTVMTVTTTIGNGLTTMVGTGVVVIVTGGATRQSPELDEETAHTGGKVFRDILRESVALQNHVHTIIDRTPVKI